MTRERIPPSPAFLRRVRLKNYKSIATCNVALGRLVALVGRNGSGKSNFLDAMRFVSDGLSTTLDHALRERGGLAAVRRHSTGHPRNFSIGLDLEVRGGVRAAYAFEIASRSGGGFVVKREDLQVRWAEGDAHYRVEEGQVTQSTSGSMPQASSDRLYLVTVSGLPLFRPIYDALASMGFYNLNPEAMKRPQSPDAGELLHRDGSNVSSVIDRLSRDAPEDMDRVRRYLERIVPGVEGFQRISIGPQETIEFRTRVEGSEHPWRFYAMNMSDGTLRALGILVAVAQLSDKRDRVRFVGIEEPETALHPAAAGALVAALREASHSTQIAVTTHSPELLDDLDLDRDTIVVVQSREGKTELAGIDAASREAVQQHLYSPGELLRMDQLRADDADVERQRQVELFAGLTDAEANP
ncbi:AAA family ATPase [Paraliomyxa miuraensis]|uniref:AAA family ATPase n=1 Tax=Paraliomyxa miuraensis TaxID=376150 RepID=UPI00224E3E66|nr:AAA family ATPase [Paraliomyxa miuraensis]MCX4244093.1 AAA family ATPase [Paraliomyxa miuraensis]